MQDRLKRAGAWWRPLAGDGSRDQANVKSTTDPLRFFVKPSLLSPSTELES